MWNVSKLNKKYLDTCEPVLASNPITCRIYICVYFVHTTCLRIGNFWTDFNKTGPALLQGPFKNIGLKAAQNNMCAMMQCIRVPFIYLLCIWVPCVKGTKFTFCALCCVGSPFKFIRLPNHNAHQQVAGPILTHVVTHMDESVKVWWAPHFRKLGPMCTVQLLLNKIISVTIFMSDSKKKVWTAHEIYTGRNNLHTCLCYLYSSWPLIKKKNVKKQQASY